MVGERLAEIRKDHGETQGDLASALGVSLHTVRSWEREKSSPPHELLVALCRRYSVTSDYLLGLSDVDPAYVQRRRLEFFDAEELRDLREFEEFLYWRKRRRRAEQSYIAGDAQKDPAPV